MQKERVINADDYGFFLLSLDTFDRFLKERKIRTKKIVSLLSKNHDLLHECVQEGILLPIIQISAFDYRLFISTETPLSEVKEEWEIILQEGTFNLKIGIDNQLWFIAQSKFTNWNKEQFLIDEDYTGYRVPSGPEGFMVFNYTGQRFNIPGGEYLIKVLGLRRKELTQDTDKDFGYFFELIPTNSIANHIISPEIRPDFVLGYK